MVPYFKRSSGFAIPVTNGVDFINIGYKTILPQSLIIKAQEIAIGTSEFYRDMSFKKKQKSPYGQNTVHSHFVGKVGEMGASYIFEKLGLAVQNDFMDPRNDGKADFVINGCKIEVKCWVPHVYKSFGACVSEAQVERIAQKADIIVYCTYSESDSSLIIRGWNKVQDMQYSPSVITGNNGREIRNKKMDPRPIRKLPIILKEGTYENKEFPSSVAAVM